MRHKVYVWNIKELRWFPREDEDRKRNDKDDGPYRTEGVCGWGRVVRKRKSRINFTVRGPLREEPKSWGDWTRPNGR